MTHHIEALSGFVLAAISSFAVSLSQIAPAGLEQTLQAGGTVGLIVGLTFALVFVWRDRAELMKALQASEQSRIDDAKEALTQWKIDAEKGERSRQEMIRELRNQTEAIKGK